MLISCLGVGIDAVTEESGTAPFADETPVADVPSAPVDDITGGAEPTLSLYEKLMSAETEEEVLALIDGASEDELAELTFEQMMEVENRFASENVEIIGPQNVISSSQVAPLVERTSDNVTMRKARMFRAFSAAANKETDEGHEGLFINKNASDNGDGTYTISLEAYVTGSIKISSETKNLPADIVLVLDVSGSMDDKIQVGSKNDLSELDTNYGAAEGIYEYNSVGLTWVDMRYRDGKWQYDGLFGWTDLDQSHFGSQNIRITKMNALKIATKNFIDQVQAKSAADEVDHKIAIVKFAGNNSSNVGNDMYNSGSYNYSQKVMNLTSVTQAATIKTNIDNLTAGGATSADYGMSHAKDVVNGITRESNKVVIMFTDGEPNHGNGFDNAVANSTIATSKEIKAAGATVYTIGVLSGADDTVPMPSNATNVNKYLHYVSSNFKNANSLTDAGNPTYPADGKSYYLAASNADQITGIFKQISEQIETGGASRTLSSTSVMKDTVSQYFDMPENASDIKVYTAKYLGYENDGTTRKFADKAEYSNAEVTVSGQSVSVTNFDYSSTENCVTDTTNANGSTTYTGSKLIVEFTVTPKEGFLGGNDVPTNGSDSGIYESASAEKPVGSFKVPTVNVPVEKPSVSVNNKTVYEGGSTAASGLYNAQSFTWQDDFVDAVYAIDGKPVSGDLSPKDCTDYEVSLTYKPKTDGSASQGTPNAMEGKTDTKTATIHVLKPAVSVTMNDVVKYYGESCTPGEGNNISGTVEWKDAKHKSIPDVEGTAPYTARDLVFTYDKGEFTVPKSDTEINVTVKAKGTDITGKTAFTVSCSDGCNVRSEGKYIVHAKTCSLTVQKQGGTDGEPYVFSIMKDGKYYTSVTVIGNEAVTVKELPVGTYSIAEDMNWAWRFAKSDLDKSSVTLSAQHVSDTIICTNSGLSDSWLNGFSNVVKNVFVKSPVFRAVL